MLKRFLVVLFCVLLIPQSTYAKGKTNAVYQISTINALLKGVYDSEETFKELKKHGDFGLGTINALDGEMIALDGKFYNIKIDGKVYNVPDFEKTPFAVVTFFNADKEIKLNETMNFQQVKDFIDSKLPTINIFYAFKVEGYFKTMKVRSVPAQKKPYPPLAEAVKDQVVFDLNDVRGTVVGFRFPEYTKGINVTGYHWHFLSADKKAGGHILDFELTNASAYIDYLTGLDIDLPDSDEFYSVDLKDNHEKELHNIEN